MPHRIVPDGAQPCVWMSAGLLTYKICDRQFECDRCPLDAGLREGTLAGSHVEGRLAPRSYAGVFPEDRRYSSGHLWLEALGRPDHGRQRLGLDAFAAAIVGHCGGVSWEVSPRTVSRNEAICQIDLGLGMLSLRAPVNGVVTGGNQDTHRDPALLVTQPYEDGWLLEFQVLDDAEFGGLMTAEMAWDNAADGFAAVSTPHCRATFRRWARPGARHAGRRRVDHRSAADVGRFHVPDLLHELVH